VRRSQLIAPFGVGAMFVANDGTGLLTAGLDHWYEYEYGVQNVDIDEYKVEEWRLQHLLRVDHLRLPPDYRAANRQGNVPPNSGLTIPCHRFPQWHFCSKCGRLDKRPLSERNRPLCPECSSNMYQVPFVAICDQGHLQDFPWREWVHRQVVPTCQGVLRLKSTGNASLAGQRVICEGCGLSRNLSGITTASSTGESLLSQRLADDGTVFVCQGYMPWLGENVRQECNRHIRGSLRSASNVYFAQTRSALYLPRGNKTIPDELIRLVSSPPISTALNIALGALDNSSPEENIKKAIVLILQEERYARKLQDYSPKQIEQAIRASRSRYERETADDTDDALVEEETLRYEEFCVLREELEEDSLKIKRVNLDQYSREVTDYFSGISLIDKLRETRVFTGFTRIFSDNEQTLSQRKEMLRYRRRPWDNWLPAYVVYGEGIFLELNEASLQDWETRPEIVERIQGLERRYLVAQQNRHSVQLAITPRLVLLHTLAHLLMNRLTFECGYSSAALRERLYVSHNPDKKMAGILIYTADGDAEGTLGGLVRMGKPGYLEPVVRRALENATWCSADPVCSEIGGASGQGPDSCNLAACHNCSLVPETSCEHFNRFLDRTVVVGEISRPELGFFRVR